MEHKFDYNNGNCIICHKALTQVVAVGSVCLFDLCINNSHKKCRRLLETKLQLERDIAKKKSKLLDTEWKLFYLQN